VSLPFSFEKIDIAIEKLKNRFFSFGQCRERASRILDIPKSKKSSQDTANLIP